MKLIPKYKEVRQEKNLSQEEVAKIAKMTPSQLSQLENGFVKDPRLKTLWRVSKAMGCTINNLYEECETEIQDTELEE